MNLSELLSQIEQSHRKTVVYRSVIIIYTVLAFIGLAGAVYMKYTNNPSVNTVLIFLLIYTIAGALFFALHCILSIHKARVELDGAKVQLLSEKLAMILFGLTGQIVILVLVLLRVIQL